MMNFVFQTRNCVLRTMELFIKNEEVCMKNDGFCIKNEEVCMKNDGFCRLKLEAKLNALKRRMAKDVSTKFTIFVEISVTCGLNPSFSYEIHRF